jgi:REP element-mobilizing transposase RayT
MSAPLPGGRRLSIRLSAHDYSASAMYFLTLCAYRRAPLFGRISDGVVALSPAGRIVRDLWIKTSEMRPGVLLDAFVIMPDHMHAIIALPPGAGRKSEVGSLRCAAGSLGALVAGYKASCTSEVRRLAGTTRLRLWQRNYYERVIRDGCALEQMRRYIAANPAHWFNRHVTSLGARTTRQTE